MLILMCFLAFLIMVILSYIGFETNGSDRDTIALRLRALEQHQEIGASVEEEMSRSFKERLVTPLFESISRFFSSLLPSSLEKAVEKTLINSGGFYGLSSEHFFGLSGILGVIFSIIAWEASMLTNQPTNKIIFFTFICFVIGIFLPLVLLKQRAITRHENLQRELPDVLDLLTVSVEAGLGFDGALVKLAERMKGDMVDEFTRMLQEMRIGVPRREALRSLAARCNVQDVTLFTGALIQADKLGVSIANVLRIQSVEMREKRRQRAEEQAMKAPIKMLFPLIFFIFPTLFIVLLGPAMITIISMFSNK